MKEGLSDKIRGFEITLHDHDPRASAMLDFFDSQNSKIHLPDLLRMLNLRKAPAAIRNERFLYLTRVRRVEFHPKVGATSFFLATIKPW